MKAAAPTVRYHQARYLQQAVYSVQSKQSDSQAAVGSACETSAAASPHCKVPPGPVPAAGVVYRTARQPGNGDSACETCAAAGPDHHVVLLLMWGHAMHFGWPPAEDLTSCPCAMSKHMPHLLPGLPVLLVLLVLPEMPVLHVLPRLYRWWRQGGMLLQRVDLFNLVTDRTQQT